MTIKNITHKLAVRQPTFMVMVLVAIMALSSIAMTVLPGNGLSQTTNLTDVEYNISVSRGNLAWGERYTALAAYYAALSPSLSPGMQAWAARYTALATYYSSSSALERGWKATAERYTALAQYYASK